MDIIYHLILLMYAKYVQWVAKHVHLYHRVLYAISDLHGLALHVCVQWAKESIQVHGYVRHVRMGIVGTAMPIIGYVRSVWMAMV